MISLEFDTARNTGVIAFDEEGAALLVRMIGELVKAGKKDHRHLFEEHLSPTQVSQSSEFMLAGHGIVGFVPSL